MLPPEHPRKRGHGNEKDRPTDRPTICQSVPTTIDSHAHFNSIFPAGASRRCDVTTALDGWTFGGNAAGERACVVTGAGHRLLRVGLTGSQQYVSSSAGLSVRPPRAKGDIHTTERTAGCSFVRSFVFVLFVCLFVRATTWRWPWTIAR
jgi:hypothetical protein